MAEEQTYSISGKAGDTVQLSSINQLGWHNDGYIFKGWGETRDAETIAVRDGMSVDLGTYRNLYAIWAPTDYLCFTAQSSEGTTVQLTSNVINPPSISLQYAINSKKDEDFTDWTNVEQAISLPETGDKVYIRAKNKNERFGYIDSSGSSGRAGWYFKLSGGFIAASGNIMSLLDKTIQQDSVTDYCFRGLFYNCDTLIAAPELPAKIINNNCYAYMFQNCVNLISSPSILPAETLQYQCYTGMFSNCKSLLKSPDIKGTKFQSSDTLSYMFEYCSNLRYISIWFNSWSYEHTNWVSGVLNLQLCKFVCPADLGEKRGTNYIPSGWTIEWRQTAS